MEEIVRLESEATEIRKRTLEIIYSASGGHTGGALSSVDIPDSLLDTY